MTDSAAAFPTQQLCAHLHTWLATHIVGVILLQLALVTKPFLYSRERISSLRDSTV